MKKIIQFLFRKFGYDIIKYRENNHENKDRSVRSKRLSFYKTKTGNYYLPTDASLDIISNAIINDEIFDVEIYNAAKKYIIKGTTALDIGSNFGQMAVLMSKLVGEDGEVHAFDADDFVFDVLLKNIQENSKNITAHFGAVHDKSDQLLHFPVQDFERFGTYGSYGIDYVNDKGRPVKSITIDEIDYKLPVSFIKIDVQGGDLLAMKGAVKTINKYRMPIIFEYEYTFEEELKLSFQEYVDFVKSIDYKFEKVIDGQNYLILPVEKKYV